MRVKIGWDGRAGNVGKSCASIICGRALWCAYELSAPIGHAVMLYALQLKSICCLHAWFLDVKWLLGVHGKPLPHRV